MSLLGPNLKVLRKRASLTQEQFAEKVGLKRAAVGAYEEGRADPRVKTLLAISHFFNVGTEDLLNKDLSDPSNTVDLPGNHLRVLSVSVDSSTQEESIALVPVKASAGYAAGYGDPGFVGELPQFQLPLPEVGRGKTHRMFQIQGESMLPIPSKSYVLAYYVQDWRSLPTDQCYIVITKEDGVVYKRLKSPVDKDSVLYLGSDNPDYPDIEIPVRDVAEIWKAHGYFSFELPEKNSRKPELNQMVNMMAEMKGQLDKLQND